MRNKDDTKLTVKWILFNIFIILLFSGNIYNSLPVKCEKQELITGCVEEIYLITANGPDYLNIYIDSEKYVLSEVDGGISVQYIYDNIKIGDFVSLKYKTNLTYKIITEFSAENQKYRTTDEYNQSIKGLSTFYLILLTVFEFFNISATIFFLWCRKPLKNKKKRKKTKKVNTSF